MNGEARSIVLRRLARAREAIEEARVLFEAGHVNTYVNRLYYACFYAVSALLLAKGMAAKRHSQLRALLHRELVRPGLLPATMGRYFDLLFTSRQKGDYDDLTTFRAEEVSGWLEETCSFVGHIEALLQEILGT